MIRRGAGLLSDKGVDYYRTRGWIIIGQGGGLISDEGLDYDPTRGWIIIGQRVDYYRTRGCIIIGRGFVGNDNVHGLVIIRIK